MMDPLEKFIIRDELTLKRYRRFKRNRSAVISIWIFMAMIFFSFTAELWSNSVPHVMKYNGGFYFPLQSCH